MKLGDKILKLRKQKGLSQEQLGEKINVTRQTISNWELGETSPNPKQLKLLSKVLNISIDEMLDNNIKEVLVEKVSNTEKLAGIIIKILKIIGIVFLLGIVFIIVMFFLFATVKRQPAVSETKQITLSCNINNNDYLITIGSGSYFNCDKCDKKMNVYLRDITDWANIDNGAKNIEKYFADNGGSCE